MSMRDPWRLAYHLMPPEGWLNDPNGLCQFRGTYHIFFQYAPKEPGPDGRPARTWGHYAGPDLLHLSFAGVPFWPVDPADHDGCYSGSALVEEDRICLYYTGNVKQPGKYDYTYAGREANEILVETDGETFGDKKVLLTGADYPEDCTCHVRDPKVWKEDSRYFMVLGARVTGAVHEEAADRGEVLLYESADGIGWNFKKRLSVPERFGYMWECPDYFELEGHTFLGICPQGLAHEEYRYQNVHQSGYYHVEGPLSGEQTLTGFEEWDYGFDFYAPQTFVDEAGRRILIGWAGLPDKPYGNPTADLAEKSWENCLTVPRVLSVSEGAVLQNPGPELEELRYGRTTVLPDRNQMVLSEGAGDFEISFPGDKGEETWRIRIGTDAGNPDAELSYEEGVLTLRLSDSSGCGRNKRRVKIPSVGSVRLLVDRSMLEVFVDGGRYVLASRFYPAYPDKEPELTVSFETGAAVVTGWQMRTMETNREA